MTPQEILDHNDNGELWPAEAGAAFGDLPSAYAIALEVRALRIERGELPRGFKVGFTNRTIWRRYNVYAPIWGSMWNTTVEHCSGVGKLSLARLCQPRIEPEAVFGFKAAPPMDATLDELFDALDWVAPGFEIVQSHMPDWKFTAPQTVADAGLHGRLVIGTKVPVAILAPDADQLHRMLARAQVQLNRNGVPVESGLGAHVLNSPLHALMYFLKELRSCPGAPDLAAGDVVTTGTWTDAWPVRAGETWDTQFDAALPPLATSFD